MKQILHSKIIGSGKALIILHGLLGMGDNWMTLARKYSDYGFQVHLVDQRNHGRSFHEDEMNYDVLVEDLHEYVEHYNLKDILLLGHSMGGKTAMFFAVEFPKKIKKLIVVDISPKKYPPHHKFIFNAIDSIDLSVDNRKCLEKQLDNKIQNFAITNFLLKNIKRNKKEGFVWKANIPVLKHCLNEIGEELPALSVFEKPALFIKGEKSSYITKNDYPLIKAHFPNVTIDIIEGAGHWVHSEKHESFFIKTMNFIK